MIAAVDVHYRDPQAAAVCVLFSDWEAEKADYEIVEVVHHVEPYVTGRFYKRELPCILRVLDKCPVTPEIVIVDGFVWLGGEDKPGLGAHLYEALGRSVAVVGVAKNEFRGAGPLRKIYRGTSEKTLLVSAAGMSIDDAAQSIKAMHGHHRIPTLLSITDRLSRSPSVAARP